MLFSELLERFSYIRGERERKREGGGEKERKKITL